MCIKTRIKNKTSSVTLKRNGKVYTRKLPNSMKPVFIIHGQRESRHRQNRGVHRHPKRPISLSRPNGVRKLDPYSEAARLGEANLGPGYANNCQPPRTQAQKFLYVLWRQKPRDHQRLESSAGLSRARSYNSDMQQKISPAPLQCLVCSN